MGLTAFVDEVDSGIHDLLMNDILRLLKNAVDQTDEGQFIATTHNTLLMDSVPADEVYVLKADAEGEKRLSVSRTIDSVRRRQTVLDINIWMAAIKESQKLDTWILQNLLMKLWN